MDNQHLNQASSNTKSDNLDENNLNLENTEMENNQQPIDPTQNSEITPETENSSNQPVKKEDQNLETPSDDTPEIVNEATESETAEDQIENIETENEPTSEIEPSNSETTETLENQETVTESNKSETESTESTVAEVEEKQETIAELSETESELTETVEEETKAEESSEAVAAPAANVEENHPHHDEDEVEDHSEDFSTKSPEELADLFQDKIRTDNFFKIRSEIESIKDILEEAYDHQYSDMLNAFIADGGEEKDFSPNLPEWLTRYKANLEFYRHRLQKEKETLEQIKQENFKAKQAIVEKLRSLLENDETEGSFKEVKELQQKWKDIGGVPAANAPEIWDSYRFLIDKFYDNVKINRELKELDLTRNLQAKLELCEKAEELILEESVKKAIDSLNQLHEHWKELGPVPKEKKDEIWLRFKHASDQIYDKRREFFKDLNEIRKVNLDKKLGLCTEIETLIEKIPDNHGAWNDRTVKVLEIQSRWKEIGFAPIQVNNQIWKRFKAACDVFFNEKNNFYKGLRQEQLNNQQAKMELCLKAESLMESTDWKATTEELIKLQKEWKEIGPVPRKYSDKLWKRFRNACDAFFNKKTAQFAGQDAEQAENLVAKRAILAELEAFEASESVHEDLERLKDVQRRWMDIGYIPIKFKSEVQEKYRKLIDKHFQTLKLSANEISKMKFQSKMENIAGEKGGDRNIKKEQMFLSSKISKIKNDISIWENNMGFFMNSKNADAMKKEIEKKIEEGKKELTQLEEKLSILREI